MFWARIIIVLFEPNYFLTFEALRTLLFGICVPDETTLMRLWMRDCPDKSPPWWESTLVGVHPDERLQWWEFTLMRDHCDHLDERPPWSENTMMRVHPDDRPPWWESTLMKVHSDQRPPLLESTLMRPLMKDHPDDTSDERPPWWEPTRDTGTTPVRNHPDEGPPCWETTLMKDHLLGNHPAEGPPWWEPTREAGATLNGHDAVQHSDVWFPQRYTRQAVQLLQERLRHELQLWLPLLQSGLAVLVPAPTLLHLHRLCTHTYSTHTII